MLRRPAYALSVKQPWAALIVAGRKSIEVRKWATSIRGRVYIHAARTADNRPAAWEAVTVHLKPLADLRGGVIGAADLTGCVLYRTSAEFAADVPRHGNDPDWFVPPCMYGFTFRGGLPVSFVPCRGSVRFFRVPIPETA
ncbi:MAG TPA: ASCH domain-containing protein [Gemmataceae bacterium]|nr:ASCH domain-containing protein [Gemmataceae bacterium]